jgi:hypothetical protein
MDVLLDVGELTSLSRSQTRRRGRGAVGAPDEILDAVRWAAFGMGVVMT